ncbi:MAG: PucR family transcriptional regulator ligand-binding domain-containing protein [Microcella sp.]|uniref:PucR family transcriptional regulator ligand-binding domain-containing protein n=1 Tax=Microcella sp. TaxID=1913979 RepID=UPI0033162F89
MYATYTTSEEGSPVPVTVADLTAHAHLGLRIVWADDHAAARAWSWVHSSDLADPTPFLGVGDALLTTGTQWTSDDDIEPWVGRLAEAGVPGVGFGTEVIRDGTPEALISACRRHGIALIEVPYRTPFIAVTRAVADADAHQRYARVRWTLDTQRALALAALRPDGVAAVLAELGRRIDAPVALVQTDSAQSAAPDAVTEAAHRMLAAGRRAARSVDGWSLQTVGAPGSLAGILAVGPTTPDDDAVRAVVTSVVAMTGLASRASGVTGEDDAAERLALLRTHLARLLADSDPAPRPPLDRRAPSSGDLLSTLRAHDAATGEHLEETLTAWLQEDTVAEAAALRLGIHRHTVRARLRRAADALSLDLASFAARAELWSALREHGRL